jgi:hypothetical protein
MYSVLYYCLVKYDGWEDMNSQNLEWSEKRCILPLSTCHRDILTSFPLQKCIKTLTWRDFDGVHFQWDHSVSLIRCYPSSPCLKQRNRPSAWLTKEKIETGPTRRYHRRAGLSPQSTTNLPQDNYVWEDKKMDEISTVDALWVALWQSKTQK